MASDLDLGRKLSKRLVFLNGGVKAPLSSISVVPELGTLFLGDTIVDPMVAVLGLMAAL